MAEVVRTYHRNGSLKEEYFMINGQIEGIYKSYHENGWNYQETITSVKNISNGNIFFGQLNIICNYINDKEEGEYKSYHENGQLYEICNYINDKREGGYKRYSYDGQLIRHRIYENGKIIQKII